MKRSMFGPCPAWDPSRVLFLKHGSGPLRKASCAAAYNIYYTISLVLWRRSGRSPQLCAVGRCTHCRAQCTILLHISSFTRHQRQESVMRLPSVWQNPITFRHPRLPPFLLDIFDQIVLPTIISLYHQSHFSVISPN